MTCGVMESKKKIIIYLFWVRSARRIKRKEKKTNHLSFLGFQMSAMRIK